MRNVKKYFLDTSFLIDLINEWRAAVRKHNKIKGREATGSPCIYELSKFTQFDLSGLFSQTEVLSFELEDAEAAGNIYYNLAKSGEKLAEIDTIIAGMVKNRGLVLVTRDRDFERIEGIKVELYG